MANRLTVHFVHSKYQELHQNMFLKIFVFATIATVVSAGIISSPLGAPVVRAEPYNPNPSYSFLYEVQDPSTGDSHGQYETRNGDVVQGAYALMDSDGTRRLVEYTADPVNGFNAVVSKQPTGKAVVAPAAPVIAAPLVKYAH